MNFKIECDGEKTRFFLGGAEVTDYVNTVVLKCDYNGVPEVSIRFSGVKRSEAMRIEKTGKIHIFIKGVEITEMLKEIKVSEPSIEEDSRLILTLKSGCCAISDDGINISIIQKDQRE